jgi:hypothetical protein
MQLEACFETYIVIAAAMQRPIAAASRFPSRSEQSRLPSRCIRFRLRMPRMTYVHLARFSGETPQSGVLKRPDTSGRLRHCFLLESNPSMKITTRTGMLDRSSAVLANDTGVSLLSIFLPCGRVSKTSAQANVWIVNDPPATAESGPLRPRMTLDDGGGDTCWQRSSLPERKLLHLGDVFSRLLLANNIEFDDHQA